MAPRKPTTSLQWHLRELLNQLAADATIEQARVARLEWGFLPILDGHIHNPDVLHRALAGQPELFVDLVSILYRAEGEDRRPKEEITEDDRQRASRAWSRATKTKRWYSARARRASRATTSRFPNQRGR